MSTRATTVTAVTPASMDVLTLKQARELVGGLGQTSKMPGHSYGIPAEHCRMGGRLRNVVGSTCQGCYAYKVGNYRFRNVQAGLQHRYESLQLPEWVPAMARQISAAGDDYFRWHDSGDLQGPWHLSKIMDVAGQTPDVRHWLPTREYADVIGTVKPEDVPGNLCIRLSAHKVNGKPPIGLGYPVSSVHTPDKEAEFRAAGAHICPASQQGHQCKDCRACWSRDVAWVSYPIHSISNSLMDQYGIARDR